MASCWLCDRPVNDPPEVIGQYLAGQIRLAHRSCLRTLGELELDLRRAEGAGLGPAPQQAPGRP